MLSHVTSCTDMSSHVLTCTHTNSFNLSQESADQPNYKLLFESGMYFKANRIQYNLSYDNVILQIK